MIIERVQRVANPTKRKRKLSKAQIAAGFGGKRRKVNAKRRRKVANPKRRKRAVASPKRRRRRVAVANPRRKRRTRRANASPKRRRRRITVANPKRRRRRVANPKVRTKYKTRTVVKYRTRKVVANPRRKKRSKRKNPAIVTLGYLNPGRTKMARRKRSTKRRRRVAVANPHRRKRRYHARGRKSNPRRVRRHRNPGFMGNTQEAIGVLAGVAIQKVVNGFVPSSLTSGNSLMTSGVAFVVAFAVGKGADMILKGSPISKGIALGALASAASTAINAFVPSLGSAIGLSGFGVYQPAMFAVPENPVMRGMQQASVPVVANQGMSGNMLSSAFGNSF